MRVRYLVDDALYAASRLPVSGWRGVRAFWFGIDVYTRRRLGVALGAGSALALILFAAAAALPCQFPGGDRCPPDDDAIGLVPRDALVYIHVNLDPDEEQFRAADEVASRLAALGALATGQLLSRLPGPDGRPADFKDDVAPWFGGEAALALVPGSGAAAQEVQLIETSSEDGAQKYAASLSAGEATTSKYRGVRVSVGPSGLATAVAGGFLIISTGQGVHEAIDAESKSHSLADSPNADEARDALPDDRLADVYLSNDAIAQLVTPPGSLLSQLSPFVDPGASRGVAAAIVAGDNDLQLAIRSVIDPKRAKANPGFFSAFPPFEPVLARALPENALAYVGLGDPAGTIKSLLEQATASAPGLAGAFTAAVAQVSESAGVDLEKDLFPSLGGEAALGLERAPRRGSDTPPASGEPPVLGIAAPETPLLAFIASGVDEEPARDGLARLQGPIARAFSSDAGLQAPTFAPRKLGGVEAQSGQLSPTVELTYAVFESLLVVATQPAGVARLVGGDVGLGATDEFEQATDGFPDEPSLLAYLDLDGLIRLAEGAGLGSDPAYATFARDLRLLQALGLAVESSDDLLSTDVRIVIGVR